MFRLKHTLNAIVYPESDVSGQWLIHCLELDLMTVGNSPNNALDMLIDGIQTIADSNLQHGLPPLMFRGASVKNWNRIADGIVGESSRTIYIEGIFFSEEVVIHSIVLNIPE